jgi:serine/threonine protein kinase/tetratricopeptide (TPR) repeat protein
MQSGAPEEVSNTTSPLNKSEATIVPAASLPGDSDGTGTGSVTPRDQEINDPGIQRRIDSGAVTASDATIAPGTSIRRSPPPGANEFASSVTLLQVGSLIGNRYEILELLGEGGMGAVYKAADREIDRIVALKVIRPELASSPQILARFKQELLLSHRVTHRNVVRIYDLAEAQGLKFITMEFIEGRDLRTILHEKKKLPTEEAVEVARQVCQALEAAHSVGIIHRDLKPQNIMQDSTGRVLVMDFGLARTLGGDGMTQTGALVGTLEYMSPEQALSKELDQRSDIFAFGLILYEMLAGERPFVAESALASLIKRTQEPARPISELDAEIPGVLGGIVSKCLERDLTGRYQQVSEILADLANWKSGQPPDSMRSEVRAAVTGRGIPSLPWRAIAAGAVLIVLAVIGYRLLSRSGAKGTASPGPTLSLAILPFRNASSDASLDWLGSSLADMLTTDVGQSASLRTVSPGAVHQIFSDLRISPSSVLDPATIKRVADFGNADQVVWGQYARFGNSIRIDATLEDVRNNRVVPLKVDVGSEKDIPAGIDHLADLIRQTLALPQDVLKELKASSFQPTSNSIAALRDYNQGLGFQRDGKNLDARKQFEAATKEDPTFALAFARLAQAYGSLGYDSDAEQSARKAVLLSQNLPEAEKYQISAIELQVNKRFPEAIEAYENLARMLPDNSDVRAVLARLYEDSGNLAKAREYYQKILTANPTDIGATIDLGRIQIKSGDARGSFESLNRAYSLSVQVDNQEQKATSLHLTAVAYRMLNKPEEVLRSEREALTIWRQLGQQRGLAFSLNEMARAQRALGQSKDAMANFNEALEIRRQIGDKRGLGDTLIDMGNLADDDRGDHDGALKLYKEALGLEREIGNQSLEAVCLNNIGSVYSEKGQYADALTYLQQVLELREKAGVPQDTVDALHNLGQALTSMGEYDQAINHYMKALDLRRSLNDTRGAALESYGLGQLFEYQGRFGAAIHSKEEALKTFRDLKDRTFWMAEILGGYGQSLILGGRMDDAKAPLDEALALSLELNNDGLHGQTLGFQGDSLFYKGDFGGARELYAQALEAATRSKETERILLAKVDLARVDVREKKGPAAIQKLRSLVKQADEAGLKYSSVECSIFMAEAMLQARDVAHARQELGNALLRSDKLGQQALNARAHYLLGTIARESKDTAGTRDNFRWVVNTLDAMKKDPGAENLLERADMKLMYDDSSNWLKTAGN